jgi:predicted Holliday junction resolvase-like endonuclease
MNLVGKIFTVLIFLMCIVFSTFALMVHSAQKNWREVVVKQGGLADQLGEAEKINNDLVGQVKSLKTKLDDERKWIQDRLKALEQASKDAKAERDAATDKLFKEEARVGELSMTVKVTASRLNVLQTTIDGMRQEIKVAVDTRNATQKNLIDTNDKLLNAVAERERLEKLNRTLAQQLTDARLASSTPPAVPIIQGEVTAVRGDDVEISVGADDGVRKGLTFVVTRPSVSKYIGKMQVIRVDYPNRAVCRPDRPSLNDQIQRGDHVETDAKSRVAPAKL